MTDEIDAQVAAAGIGADPASLRPAWDDRVRDVLDRGDADAPARRLDAQQGRQARRPHRASRLSSWPRCSSCSAPIRARPGEADAALPALRRRSGTGSARCPIRRSRSISLADLGIVRDVAWDGDDARRHRHADLFRLPGHARSSTSTIETRASRARASRSVRSSAGSSPPWTTDWISDEGREKLRAYGIAPPVDGTAATALRAHRSPAGRLTIACPRCGSTDTAKDQPVRLDALQGAATAAATAWNPSTTSSASERTRTMARFHPLDRHRRAPRDARRRRRDPEAAATRTRRSSTSPRAST